MRNKSKEICKKLCIGAVRVSNIEGVKPGLIVISDKQIENLIDEVIRECLILTKESSKMYENYQKNTQDFSEKNRFAQGLIASENIASKIKEKFNFEE